MLAEEGLEGEKKQESSFGFQMRGFLAEWVGTSQDPRAS